MFYFRIASLLFFLTYSCSVQSEELLFLAHKSAEQNEISPAKLSRIFLKQDLYWSSGLRIRPIDHNIGSTERKLMLKNILDKTEIELSEFWIKQKQKRGLTRPLQIEKNANVIQLLGDLPGAVGYISSGYDKSKGFPKDVRILKVKTD
jgi:ABC-type phosphate transport system substrate-binding protein